ncbi:MAG: hypothetical protein U0325_22300 [Polyangiales bacterium]
MLLSACTEVECARNSDCPERARCELNLCRSDCRQDRDCDDGAVCSANGMCVPARDAATEDRPDVVASKPDRSTTDIPTAEDRTLPNDQPAATEAATPMDAPDVVTAHDVVDAAMTDVAMDAATPMDAPDVVTAPDVVDARDVVDVPDVVDARDVVDVPDVVAARDVVDVPVVDVATCTALPWSASVIAGAGQRGGTTALALDPQGGVHVVLHRASSDNYATRELLFASRQGDSWNLEGIATGTGNDRDDTTDLAFDRAGVPHVVYPGYFPGGSMGHVPVHTMRVAGRWSATPLRGGNTWASLGVDGAGAVHVVSGSTEIRYAMRTPDGAWTFETQRPARCPTAAVAPDGTVFVAYLTPPPAGTAPNEVMLGTRSPGGAWAFERIDTLDTRLDYTCLTRAVRGVDGSLFVAYQSGAGLRLASRAPGGPWRLEVVTPSGGLGSLAVDPAGGLHVVHSQPAQHAFRAPGGAWRTSPLAGRPQGVSGSDLSCAVDASGALHVASYEAQAASAGYPVTYAVGRACAP